MPTIQHPQRLLDALGYTECLSLMTCSLKAAWKVHFVLFMQANFNSSCLASSSFSLYAVQRSLIRFQKYGQIF